MSNTVQGHILKFLDKQSLPIRTSKRFRPQQTFGHSKQSPDWFKHKFSLQAKGGYEYKFDDPKFKQKFKYLSQKHNLIINNQEKKLSNDEEPIKNSIHNRKKGLLSEYLDNNSWMKEVVPLMGVQRDQQSRRLNHVDRDKKIQTMRLKSSTYIAAKTASNFYSTKFSKMRSTIKTRQIKTSHERNSLFAKGDQLSNPQNLTLTPSKKLLQNSNHSRSKSITLLMGQKQKIRTQRNQQAFNKIHKIEKVNLQDTLIAKKFKTIDAQFVQERMAKTARQWGNGTGQGNIISKKLSPQKSIQRFDNMISQQSSISNKIKLMNREVFNKKLSAPIVFDISDSMQNHKYISNQI